MTPARTFGSWIVHPASLLDVVLVEHADRQLGSSEDDAVDQAYFAQVICSLRHLLRHRPESEVRAIARLIAAAPELLVQLKGLLGLAKFIISSADIDAEATTCVLRNNGEPVAEVPIAVLLAHSEAAIAKATGSARP